MSAAFMCYFSYLWWYSIDSYLVETTFPNEVKLLQGALARMSCFYPTSGFSDWDLSRLMCPLLSCRGLSRK
jgi:hypothetical protein